MTDIIETMARAIVPAMLETSESYSDVPPEHIWTRPRYQWLAEASRRHAQAALTAITEAGFVVCPREPTEAMIKVGVETECGLGPYTLPDVIAASYRAMIAASPVTHCNHTNNGKAE